MIALLPSVDFARFRSASVPAGALLYEDVVKVAAEGFRENMQRRALGPHTLDLYRVDRARADAGFSSEPLTAEATIES